MNIKAEIYKTIENGSKLKAIGKIVIEDAFVVKNVRVIQGAKGIYVVMPSRQNANGEFDDICYPILDELRLTINCAVLDAYEKAKGKVFQKDSISPEA